MASTADPIKLFDRALLRRMRLRTQARRTKAAFLANWTARNLVERLDDVKRSFSSILISGLRADPDNFAKILKRQSDIFVAGMDLADLHGFAGGARVCGDPEILSFKNGAFDLVLSLLDLHNANDLPGALIQTRRALKADGLFMAAMLGGETLYELRHCLAQAEIEIRGGASPRVFPFADKQQAGALMQRAGFALPVVDSEIITVSYPSMFALLHDLRAMGEGNIITGRDVRFAGRDCFARAAAIYAESFPDKEEAGRIKASFEIIFMTGWAPHESQPQPLKPGSAKNRLSDVLSTDEYKKLF